MTFFDVDHTVEELGQVETKAFAGILIVGAGRSTVGEPLAVREGVFQLVAVLELLLAAQNRTNFGVFDFADTVEVVLHLLLLVKDLPLIGHVLPLTAAAETEMLTYWLHALF